MITASISAAGPAALQLLTVPTDGVGELDPALEAALVLVHHGLGVLVPEVVLVITLAGPGGMAGTGVEVVTLVPAVM